MDVLKQQMNSLACLLLNDNSGSLELCIGNKKLQAVKGTDECIGFNFENGNLLGNHLGYSICLPSGELPVSIQLYNNEGDRKHWRLFLLGKFGMLLSVNFSTAQKHDESYIVEVQIKISTQELGLTQRKLNRDALVSCLENEGFTMTGNNYLQLGVYDSRKNEFTNLKTDKFICNFLRAGLIKGHFMGNKGYTFPWLAQ